ncbi:MAG: MogA/MoaB family molybdenum cofactor biosynthesis protein [Candidatus Latescibacterota bacterium]|nr:MAG: MogA/MoaB family molybdenum cofactor biosynthesis protein [Candidatus Latescibacterota bacterium]
MGLEEHRARARDSVAVYVITCSDTRASGDDASGALIRDALQEAGHRVVGWCLLREEEQTLRDGIRDVLQRVDFDAVIINGGTGIAPRDRTFDILAEMYERTIQGFGELFRSLSYAEIGSAAMLSRASAGVACNKIVFSIPGSRAAVRLALDQLILPELGHLVAEMRRARTERAP